MSDPAAPGQAAGTAGRRGMGELHATATADGVFRVRHGGQPPGAGRVRILTIAGVLAILLSLATFALALADGGGSAPPRSTAAAPAHDARAAEYAAALAMGRAGRYEQAWRRMEALGAYGSAQAAARSFGTRAAQRLVARARAIAAGQPAAARTLVVRAGERAPTLPSLAAARELVGLPQSVR